MSKGELEAILKIRNSESSKRNNKIQSKLLL